MTSISSNRVEIGSAAWMGANEYEEGSEFHRRATKFLEDIKWNQLATICSEYRQGVACHLAEKFSIGHFNMARQVVFEDGQLWIVRLRMPELKDGQFYRDVRRKMLSEVASMRFLRQRSSIPVPEVYHYDLGPNDVGAPYIIMEYIHGTVASELPRQIDAPYYQYGTPEQDEKFRRRMAAIQVEMASLTFDQIGSLYQDPETKAFYIGPECETGQGPWNSSIEYYRDVANQKLERAIRSAPFEVQDDYSFALPVLFERLIELYAEEGSVRGPFGLAHQDFGAHNILVNEDFEVLAVIDLDSLLAAPVEIQAQFPCSPGFVREAPFHVETRPLAIETIAQARPKLEEYKRMVQECEGRTRNALDPQIRLGDLMLSDISAIVLGLTRYDGHQAWVNQKWMLSFSRLLRRKIAARIG